MMPGVPLRLMKETMSKKSTKPARTAPSPARTLAAKAKEAAEKATDAKLLARLAKQRLKEARRDYKQARKEASLQRRLSAAGTAAAGAKTAKGGKMGAGLKGKGVRRGDGRLVVPLPDNLSCLIAKPTAPAQGGASAGAPGGAAKAGE